MQSRQRRTSEDIRGVKRRGRDESIFARPTGRGEILENAISGVGPGSAGKKKRHTTKRVEEEKDKKNCPCGEAIESRTHMVAEYELYQEERDVLEGEMRDLDKSGMKSFDALDSRE